MIEDEGKLPVEPPHDRYGEGLLYDYSKFITTLSLIALGGVLTLSEAAEPGDIKLHNLALVLGTITLSGVIALSTANALVGARATGQEPSAKLPRNIKISMALLSVGLGVFLAMWWDALR
jgi:hypothetical protein